MKLYQELADQIRASVLDGSLKPGDRVPSVRQLRQDRGISPATIMRAYRDLERAGLVEARHRSGYFVSSRLPRQAPEPTHARQRSRTTRVDVSELVYEILASARDRAVVPLGSAFPSPDLFPWTKLSRHLARSARDMDPWSTVESLPRGSAELRRQIARRYLRFGSKVALDEIVVTAGALEALNLSLRVLTRPGDTVAIEAPAFYAALQAIEANGLKAIEIPTHPREGMDLAALARAIQSHDVRACWLMTNFQNPLGATMPDEKKRELVRLLERQDVPLIEDDVYGELHFVAQRPRSAKSFDTKGIVLHCSSFSKCLAPGYRLGWVAAGRYAQAIERCKLTTTLSASLPIQDAIARFLQQERFDAHLDKLRQALAAQQSTLLRALHEHFPDGYRVTRPDGGYFLWVELPGAIDTLEIHRRALDAGISIAPGPIFSARREFSNCLRLNYGHIWTPAMGSAVEKLGRIIREVAKC